MPNGTTTVQLHFKEGRKVTKVKHIGTAHNDAELELLLVVARNKMHEGQGVFEFESTNKNDMYLEESYSKLLWDSLSLVYDQIGFDQIDDEIFKQLVLARIIEPASKLDTLRILTSLGLDAPSYTGIYRCLQRIVNGYRDKLSEACFDKSKNESLNLVLYDVTTLYFESQKGDEFRKPGLSKERKLDPQITVGLLVDRTGFPLKIQSFEGNRAEVKTIIPVLKSFKEHHNLKNITVTADAAMLSSENIAELENQGYHYIIGSRIKKTPYEIEDYLHDGCNELKDGQIFESSMLVTINGKRTTRRVIYQYRAKRAALDLSNIEKTVTKAENMVNKKHYVKRNRFLKITGGIREINTELVEEAKKKAGIKGYVTDVQIPAQEVINAYHQLFQVEKSFRMSKSDLKARPIYHHKKESIEAHLTIVFAALAISRVIEAQTGISIKKFVNSLKPLRTGVIDVNGTKVTLMPKIPADIAELLNKLT